MAQAAVPASEAVRAGASQAQVGVAPAEAAKAGAARAGAAQEAGEPAAALAAVAQAVSAQPGAAREAAARKPEVAHERGMGDGRKFITVGFLMAVASLEIHFAATLLDAVRREQGLQHLFLWTSSVLRHVCAR